MPDVYRGIGIGVGIVVGPLVRMGRPPELPPASPVDDPAAEVERARQALAAVSADLTSRSAAATDPTATDILDALGMIAADPTLGDDVEQLVDVRTDAVHALHLLFARHRDTLAAAGGYLAERAQDLDDLRDRAVAVALGLPMPGIPDPGHPFVLAAHDLGPADTVGIDPSRVLALVTAQGGPTSHTAILARSLGLPCVVACTGVMDVVDGTTVAVDAEAGVVEAGVDGARRDELAEQARRLAAELAGQGDAESAAVVDAPSVALLLNIGAVADLDDVVDDRFEGVGLFRTEFLFLDRVDPPSFDEQRAAYRSVLSAAAGRKVVVRTLDAGADKPLPFMPVAPGPNPALGVRGLRIARQVPEVLVTQLEALAAAVADVDGAEAWVMAPMVATAEEASWFARRARRAGLDTVGVMVEVPAAALRAREILAEVDFVSIGSNDLAQYTFAADRMEGALWNLLDPWQPALLQLIAGCAAAGAELGKPVGLCGEAAADPALSPVFAGLGVTSLSMSARAVPLVRRALGARSLADCRRLAAQVVAAPSAEQARACAVAAVQAGSDVSPTRSQ
ncbi:MAG TPA: phosphoenolpyruvate--protein phosphotransferase [Acidimicrobiales bacterium]|nr:phosphoenolpyruvate--protein phosphotransferase [Acidimicrobiales bacterium]